MKLRELIKEEWKDSFNYKGKTIEIFKNPTKKELNSISTLNPRNIRTESQNETIRFFAYNGNVYAFPSSILHQDAIYKLKMPTSIQDTNKYFEGIAVKSNGKWILLENHFLEGLIYNIERGVSGSVKKLKERLPILINKFKYLNKFIDTKNYFNKQLTKISKKHGFKKFTNELRRSK